MLFRKKPPPSLLQASGKEQVKATLIFAPAKKYKWLNHILQPGFAHVRVLIHLQYVTIYIDPRIAYNQVSCYPTDEDFPICEGETHVYTERMVDIYKLRRIVGPLNCVEEAKAFLGLAKPFIFTPYQLYKEVIKHGRHSS